MKAIVCQHCNICSPMVLPPASMSHFDDLYTQCDIMHMISKWGADLVFSPCMYPQVGFCENVRT